MKKIIVTLVLASLCNVTKGQNCALRFDALGQYADLQDLNNDYNILEFWIKIHEDGYSGAILSG
ncbi:MAG: hypothetical protein KJN84_04340, partial [Bacteroidia bacterium]|nr:hypothetical protein [Bacteroidia bacterium]